GAPSGAARGRRLPFGGTPHGLLASDRSTGAIAPERAGSKSAKNSFGLFATEIEENPSPRGGGFLFFRGDHPGRAAGGSPPAIRRYASWPSRLRLLHRSDRARTGRLEVCQEQLWSLCYGN